MTIRKILVPLDGSELAERILVHVQRLLLRSDAEVCLLHVIPENPPAGALERAHGYVDPLRERLIENGANATARLAVGDPATRILDAVRELEPSLVAMSTHGRAGVARFTRGSVAERVLRRATVPVLLANPLALPERQPLRVKRILVPLDLSQESAAVLPDAQELARVFEAELLLLHSLETEPVPDAFVPDVAATTHDGARAVLEGFAARVRDVPVKLEVLFGRPAPKVLEAAKDADLIAMTTHGRSGLSRWAFGSVAEQVIRHAPCPILVKRTAGFLEDAGSP